MLIGFPTGVRVWLAAGITDMRRGFDGLASLIQGTLLEDLLVVIYLSSEDEKVIVSKYFGGVVMACVFLLKG